MFRVSSSGMADCITLVGGYVVSHYKSGIIAGQMVKEVLTENDIAEIPVDTDTPAEYYFDSASIKKFGLNANVIPEGATFINVEPTFLDQYYLQVVFAAITIIVCLLFALLGYYVLSANRFSKINMELDHKNKELEKVSAYKSNFLSNMSHEIRTPMNGIIGMTDLALDSVKDENALKYLQEIDETSQYMLTLLNDVLDMSRIDSGKFEINKKWTNAGEILLSCINMMDQTMKSKDITFIYPDTDHFHEIELFVDSQRLKQVIMNLLNNAYKFTPAGGKVTFQLVEIYCNEYEAKYRLIVSDTGCGMSKTFLQNGIFEPFSQDDNGTFSSIRGTGLGLALVKQIITQMGGTVDVESELGKGSTFTIMITTECRKAQKMRENKIEDKKKTVELRGKNILVVEDHPLNQRIVKALLEKEGVSVKVVENGKMAVIAFENSEPFWYDAILMDVRMPIMNGYEATGAIRILERADAANIPIIAMTANAFAEDVAEALANGMNAHIAKPINYDKLFQLLKEFSK